MYGLYWNVITSLYFYVQLKLYSQSATTEPTSSTSPITDNYIGVAASLQQVSQDALQSDLVKVWLHLTVIIFPLLSWLLLHLCDPVQLLLGDKTWTKLEDEHSHGVVAALIQLSVLFTFFVFFLDIAGLHSTVTSDLIAHDSNAVFYLSTLTGLLVDVAAFVWVVFVLFACLQSDIRHFVASRRCTRQLLTEGGGGRGLSCLAGLEQVKKLLSTVMVAPVLCLANHALYIIIAFISDPLRAGSIAILYALSFFLFFFGFRQFYNRVVLHSNKRPQIVPPAKPACSKCLANEKLWEPVTMTDTASVVAESTTFATLSIEANTDKVAATTGDSHAVAQDAATADECSCYIAGPSCHIPFNTRVLFLSLITVAPLIGAYQAIMVVLFQSLPTVLSIEDAPSRIFAIYQGTGLIIASLLTYNIVLKPSPFSIPKIVERLAKRMRLPETVNYWNRMSDEEKIAKVVSRLVMEKAQSSEDRVCRGGREMEEKEEEGGKKGGESREAEATAEVVESPL